jgi:hypothetical protein
MNADRMHSDPGTPGRMRHWAAACWIGLAALLAHGVLPFTDHVLWDGWLCLKLFTRGDGLEPMWRLYQEAGRPLDYFIYRLLFLMPAPVAVAKGAAVVSWALCGWLQYLVLVKAGGLQPATARWVAALAVVLPVFDVLGDVTFWTHGVELLAFWSAVVLVVRGRPAGSIPRVAWRIAIWGLFIVAFNLNSLLVFFHALWVALWLMRAGAKPIAATLGDGIARLRGSIDLALLPLVFWIAKQVFTPTHGGYADYNRIDPDVGRLIAGCGRTLHGFLIPEIMQAVRAPGAAWAAGAGLLAVIASVAVGKRRGRPPASWDCRPWIQLLAPSLLLFAAAVLPYLLVGQDLVSHGWASRNCILTPLPLALGMAGIAAMVQSRLPSRAIAIAPCVLAVLLGVAAWSSVRSHLTLQALGAKHQSIQNGLRGVIARHGPAMIQLRDYFDIPGTIPRYPPLIWTLMTAPDGEAPSTLVFDTVQVADHEETLGPDGEVRISFPNVPVSRSDMHEILKGTSMPGVLTAIPDQGSQVLFVVSAGDANPDGVAIGLHYLRCKWLDQDQLPNFLGGLTRTLEAGLPPISDS